MQYCRRETLYALERPSSRPLRMYSVGHDLLWRATHCKVGISLYRLIIKFVITLFQVTYPLDVLRLRLAVDSTARSMGQVH